MEELLRGNCLGGKSPGEKFLGGMGARGNCLGGSCPDGNYSGAILWKAKVRVVIVPG